LLSGADGLHAGGTPCGRNNWLGRRPPEFVFKRFAGDSSSEQTDLDLKVWRLYDFARQERQITEKVFAQNDRNRAQNIAKLVGQFCIDRENAIHGAHHRKVSGGE
jgi:hypothetical protein